MLKKGERGERRGWGWGWGWGWGVDTKKQDTEIQDPVP